MGVLFIPDFVHRKNKKWMSYLSRFLEDQNMGALFIVCAQEDQKMGVLFFSKKQTVRMLHD